MQGAACMQRAGASGARRRYRPAALPPTSPKKGTEQASEENPSGALPAQVAGLQRELVEKDALLRLLMERAARDSSPPPQPR